MEREDPFELIGGVLGLGPEHAADVFMLTHWVEHTLLIERHGYPKDNALPAPLSERLADESYVRRLLEAAADEEEPDGVVLRALSAHLEALTSS